MGEEEEKVQSFSSDVEAISTEVNTQSDEAITALNRFGDGEVDGVITARVLDESAELVAGAERKVEDLRPRRSDPAGDAANSTGDLAFLLGDLSRQLEMAATDVRATERALADRRDVALHQASVLLAYQSGISALSRAIRFLAVR